mmetsp:Transcript_19973/g.55214  ORF Transcript_19973/g.55214 Transcript_19973/m.55214 type:complete len:294 (+) Transcript_19973:312-1193(+)
MALHHMARCRQSPGVTWAGRPRRNPSATQAGSRIPMVKGRPKSGSWASVPVATSRPRTREASIWVAPSRVAAAWNLLIAAAYGMLMKPTADIASLSPINAGSAVAAGNSAWRNFRRGHPRSKEPTGRNRRRWTFLKSRWGHAVKPGRTRAEANPLDLATLGLSTGVNRSRCHGAGLRQPVLAAPSPAALAARQTNIPWIHCPHPAPGSRSQIWTTGFALLRGLRNSPAHCSVRTPFRSTALAAVATGHQLAARPVASFSRPWCPSCNMAPNPAVVAQASRTRPHCKGRRVPPH